MYIYKPPNFQASAVTIHAPVKASRVPVACSKCWDHLLFTHNLVPRVLPMGKTLVGAGHVTLQK